MQKHRKYTMIQEADLKIQKKREANQVTSTIDSNGFVSTEYSDMTQTDELLDKILIPPGNYKYFI